MEGRVAYDRSGSLVLFLSSRQLVVKGGSSSVKGVLRHYQYTIGPLSINDPVERVGVRDHSRPGASVDVPCPTSFGSNCSRAGELTSTPPGAVSVAVSVSGLASRSMFFSSWVGGEGLDEADRVDGREEDEAAASWAWIRWMRADLEPDLG
jgi:hypothetical protein